MTDIRTSTPELQENPAAEQEHRKSVAASAAKYSGTELATTRPASRMQIWAEGALDRALRNGDAKLIDAGLTVTRLPWGRRRVSCPALLCDAA